MFYTAWRWLIKKIVQFLEFLKKLYTSGFLDFFEALVKKVPVNVEAPLGDNAKQNAPEENTDAVGLDSVLTGTQMLIKLKNVPKDIQQGLGIQTLQDLKVVDAVYVGPAVLPIVLTTLSRDMKVIIDHPVIWAATILAMQVTLAAVLLNSKDQQQSKFYLQTACVAAPLVSVSIMTMAWALEQQFFNSLLCMVLTTTVMSAILLLYRLEKYWPISHYISDITTGSLPNPAQPDNATQSERREYHTKVSAGIRQLSSILTHCTLRLQAARDSWISVIPSASSVVSQCTTRLQTAKDRLIKLSPVICTASSVLSNCNTRVPGFITQPEVVSAIRYSIHRLSKPGK